MRGNRKASPKTKRRKLKKQKTHSTKKDGKPKAKCLSVVLNALNNATNLSFASPSRLELVNGSGSKWFKLILFIFIRVNFLSA